MKPLSIIVAATGILLSTAAYAGDTWVPHTFTSAPFNSTERINAALAARGEPPLGSARVIEDNTDRTTALTAEISTTRSWSRSR